MNRCVFPGTAVAQEVEQFVRKTREPALKFALLGSVVCLSLATPAWSMTDTDLDGVPDSVEIAEGTSAVDAANYLDSDGDTIPDYLDIDSDGDSVPDILEYGRDPYIDADEDGVPVYLDDDDSSASVGNADNRVQVAFDPDVNNTAAFQDSTHNHEIDSDGDTVPDSIEISEGTDEASSTSFKDTDGDLLPDEDDGDADNDGIEDLLEAGVFPYYDRDCDGVPAYLDDDDYDWQIANADGRVESLFDPDNNGIAEFQDANASTVDRDGDGVPDAVENAQQTDPDDGSSFKDSDGDGIADFIDEDDDNDLIADVVEGAGDSDGDSIPNYLDSDSDGDGTLDQVEGTNDADGDFIPDFLDTDDTNTSAADSDSDGIPDALEGQNDTDNDGVNNSLDTDSDGDGINDSVEQNSDLDGDLIPNYIDLDSDGDGIPDQVEGVADIDGDGVGNFLDVDSDADGIPDLTETAADPDGDGRGNFVDDDSDADGIADSVELAGDPDADGLPNFLDDDSDGDGVPDSVELLTDGNSDGVPAYLDNSELNGTVTLPTSNSIVQTGVSGGCTFSLDNRGPADLSFIGLLMAGFLGVFRRRKRDC